MVEQMAITLQSRFCRFAPSPAWRNMGVYGMLDETRHAQLDLAFSHDLLKHDPRFDWCNRGSHTREWGVLAVKNFFDDWMLNANVVEAAIATSLVVEHGMLEWVVTQHERVTRDLGLKHPISRLA